MGIALSLNGVVKLFMKKSNISVGIETRNYMELFNNNVALMGKHGTIYSDTVRLQNELRTAERKLLDKNPEIKDFLLKLFKDPNSTQIRQFLGELSGNGMFDHHLGQFMGCAIKIKPAKKSKIAVNNVSKTLGDSESMVEQIK